MQSNNGTLEVYPDHNWCSATLDNTMCLIICEMCCVVTWLCFVLYSLCPVCVLCVRCSKCMHDDIIIKAPYMLVYCSKLLWIKKVYEMCMVQKVDMDLKPY